MYDCSTIIYDRDDYEKELRKLVRCEEEPGHPITSYGRERERVRKLLESSTEYFSKSLFPNSKISSLLTYNVEQSEFKFHNDGTLLDSSLQKGVLPDNSLFCEKSKSESLIQYIVEEIFYRALELIAVQYFPEAREVLGYKGDTDGRVYEMYSRIKTKSKEEWLPVMPSLLKKKGQLAIVNEISLIISHYALSLFFGAMQDIPIPGIFERYFDLTNSLKLLDKEVKRIFPEKGYAAIGIKSSLEFAQGYNKFLHSTAPLAPNFKYAYMPNISIINPMIITIKQEGINFYKLTLDTTQLRDFLECCLKRNGTKYVEEAIKQWKTGEANYADGRTEVLQPHEPLQDREEEMEYLRDKLSRIEAEAEVLRNELRERDGQVKKLQRELEKQSQERKQILQEQKEHAKNVVDGSGAGGNGQRGNAALQSRDALFKNILGGVGQAAVDVALGPQGKAVSGILGIGEHIGGGLVDGHRTGIGDGIGLLLADVQLKGLKMQFTLAHDKILISVFIL